MGARVGSLDDLLLLFGHEGLVLVGGDVFALDLGMREALDFLWGFFGFFCCVFSWRIRNAIWMNGMVSGFCFLFWWFVWHVGLLCESREYEGGWGIGICRGFRDLFLKRLVLPYVGENCPLLSFLCPSDLSLIQLFGTVAARGRRRQFSAKWSGSVHFGGLQISRAVYICLR